MRTTGPDVSILSKTVRSEWRKHDPIAYRVEEGMRVSGLGRTAIYAAMNDGRLASHLVGRRRLIDAASLRALVTGEAA